VLLIEVDENALRHRFSRGPSPTRRAVAGVRSTDYTLLYHSALTTPDQLQKKVYYPRHEENNPKQNATVTDLFQQTPSISVYPRLMKPNPRLSQTHPLAVAAATSVSWLYWGHPTCLSSSTNSGKNAAKPRVASVLWGLGWGSMVTKRCHVLKCQCQWTTNPRFVYFEIASEMCLGH